MTDGIIQEVNQKIQSMIDFRSKVTPYDIQTWLNLYQQELIEKIKQEFPRIGEAFYAGTVLRKLIGDNQE